MLKVIYKSRKIERQFSDEYASLWRYPADAIRGLHLVNDFLRAAVSFKSLAEYKPLHLERLSGKLKNRRKPTGEWSIRLGATSGYRAILIPCDEDEVELIGGDIMARAAVIKVVKITGVTNHYD